MKGLFLLDVEEEKQARRARDEAARAGTGAAPESAADKDESSGPAPAGKPLEDYLARWHGNWRGSSSVK
ncbi:MAG TPA: hypothetical protein VGK27_04910 [Candidatus Deferrimicrobiaceae bacterium]